MEVEIVRRSGFAVVGMMYRGRNEKNEIPRLWGELWGRKDEIGGKVAAAAACGVLGNKDPETGEFDYLAGFEVETGAGIPEGMVLWEVPEQTYAVFRCTLPEVKETFRFIFRTWLPQSAYEIAEGPELELYGGDFDPVEKPEISICIPIRGKASGNVSA